MADQPSYQMMDKTWTSIQVTDWQLIMTLWLLDMFLSLAVYKLVWWFSAMPWFSTCDSLPLLQDAVCTLNTLQTNASALEQVRRERSHPQQQLQAMRGFLERAGLTVSYSLHTASSPVTHNADHFKNHRVSLLSDRRLIWPVCLCVVFQRWRN